MQHSPADSGRLLQTPFVTSKVTTGVCRSLPDSCGVCRSLQDYVGQCKVLTIDDNYSLWKYLDDSGAR